MKGDKEALNLFYLRFAPRMLNVIRRYVSSEKDSEDILHDGFIVAFTRLKSIRNPERVDYWLATIMKNLSLQFLQQQDVAEILHEQKDVEDAPVIDSLMDMEVLESLIRKLPPGYQRVFRLSMLENKSHKEIAQILGIAPNSSSSQLFHAKLMMRRLIIDYKRQTGLLCLLLLGAGALIQVAINRVEILPDQPPLAMNAPGNESKPEAGESPHPDQNEIPSARFEAEDPENAKQFFSENTKLPLSENAKLLFSDNALPTDYNLDSQVEEEPLLSAPEITEQPTCSASEISASRPTASEISSPEAAAPDTTLSDVEEQTSAPVADVGSFESDSRLKLAFAKIKRSVSGSGWSFMAKAETGFMPGKVNSESGGFTPDSFFGPGFPAPILPDLSGSMADLCDYAGASHNNNLPISFTLAVSRALSDRISLETGLSYTYLSTTFDRYSAQSHACWHYLGIPVRVNMRSFSTGRLKLYGAIGGSLEIPLHSSARATGYNHSVYFADGSFKSPCVFTISGSYGAALKLSQRFELFIEPTVQLYLHNAATVPNIWSDNRVGFSIPVGVRFNW